ncbi:SpvB/TcaC N-terminal domain-containing protein [Mixta intestinalis]|uniref:Mono(ADP-ribosyl)transferase SpvB n=1 Tax=Mixta intestinalis TaxID=1615494 RepID=A0A6P1Q3X4_9GAMM|nr:SpvB/TcaC N-terminal domain-containing protein [Mixta intestinalis]QHM72688.1 Mono(ADP-ribosyl)transferase SpvB [Mixta intestinalis]
MQNTDTIKLELPSLPKGGGAVTGLKGDMAAAGPDGAAVLTLALPVSTGRGYAPSLALSYHSRAGNGPFGIGWAVGQPAVRRRTSKGVPTWDEKDEFTGPDGEVLVPALNEAGEPDLRHSSMLLDRELGEDFTVSAWRSRTETDFSRLEFWEPHSHSEPGFWVMYSPDGQVHLLGRTPQARISHPENPAQVAVWLAESSVSATGEQIYWQYRGEDEKGCDETETAAHPNATAQRYLTAVWYGNKVAARELPALMAEPSPAEWLFTLVLDYGERGTDADVAPEWLAPGSGEWPCRRDCFSAYDAGFDVRTRRLCRQVLMYHDVAALAGEAQAENVPYLVSRLLLVWEENASVSTLKSVQQIAYEADGRPVKLPPLTLDWQDFSPPETVQWQKRADMDRFNLLQPYRMVDLNGEGMAGILYQDGKAWWYRAPVRDAAGGADAVTWDKPAPLPAVPPLREGGSLVDLNGDGYLEWVVAASGTAGRYQRTPERGWTGFIPFNALPVEYAHIHAQLADISGTGLSDLVLIGPRSVRLYSGTGEGWNPATIVMQPDDITLPQFNPDAGVLVAFSDMAGSGQQHLVEVRAEGVRYWPALGHGRFGPPVSMDGFSCPTEAFNPDQLYFADVDGSGTTDLIYALSDRLVVWLNQSGNHFAESFSISLPEGVHYDRTCSLQLADIQGLGVASLVLTVPYPVPTHWVCHLTESKPWLLKGTNNNMGARCALTYRSSAQFWLDEKADAVAEGKSAPACYLPFALYMLCRTDVIDEITANHLTSVVRYRHGVWDGREREFRGFGFVEIRDTDVLADTGTAGEISMPAISRSWYATGLPVVDDSLHNEFWAGDEQAFPGYLPRFTTGSGDNEQAFTPDDEAAYWLRRGLKGMVLRSELYGSDGSAQADIPYSVSESRPQVRLVESRGNYPVILPVTVESRNYSYERISCDPQCSQHVLLSSDEYGQPLRQVSIRYPRRARPAQSPYPDTLPDTLFASSYDEQQQILRLALTRNTWHSLFEPASGIWITGLADAARNDEVTLAEIAVPAKGFMLEDLLAEEGPFADAQPLLSGQKQIWYLDAQGEATTGNLAFPPRVAFSEAAVLDEGIVALLAEDLTPVRLEQAGYARLPYLFADDNEASKTLWTVRSGYVTYASAAHFFLPVAVRDTLLTGEVSLARDPCDCVITQTTDAAGLTASAEYDWRFMTPVSVFDANDNLHSLTLDALGRVTTTTFRGTEESENVGYSDSAFTPPATVDAAVALSAPVPVYQCMIYVTDCWQQDQADRLPPHVAVLTTDRYDNDPQQQIRQQVTFSDGFGRVLQTSVRQTAGDAWQRGEDGSLIAGPDDRPATAQTSFRWAVSGRTEYDNKGQAVRTYQPYFLDSWKYVSDDAARQDLYADMHFYDPLGRVWQTRTAKNWLRRGMFTPWFVVSEDENDTAAEV